ncbi:hypothetical protein JTB14_014520 [Gonioctena quinquepunctata]|nr:hypothetical protein JTB14_014520 [Gonioctena quinquepunctata]
MEENKEEIEFMETRAKIMCPPEIEQESSYKRNYPKLQEPKASQIRNDGKEKGVQALSNMELSAQESAGETGNTKSTRNQRRSANRKGRRAQEQTEETDQSSANHEKPATNRPATQTQPGKAPKQGGKSTGQKLMPPIVITGILPFRNEARKEIEASLEDKFTIKFSNKSTTIQTFTDKDHEDACKVPYLHKKRGESPLICPQGTGK